MSTTVNEELEATLSRVRGLVERIQETFDPGGTLDFSEEDWALAHSKAIQTLAAARDGKESRDV